MAKRFKELMSVKELGAYLNQKKYIIPDCAVFMTFKCRIYVGVYHKGDRIARVEDANPVERETLLHLCNYWCLSFVGISKRFGKDPWRKVHDLEWTIYMKKDHIQHYDFIPVFQPKYKR